MTEIVATKPCPHCTGAIYPDARFCSSCGKQLTVEEEKDRVAVLKDFAVGTLHGAEETARDALANRSIKKLAGGAVLGLGVAAVVPFVSFTLGATVGAAFVGYKLLTKD